MSDKLKSEISNFESEVRRKSSALERARRLNTILGDVENWRNSGNSFSLFTEANTTKGKKIEVPDECRSAVLGLLEKYSIETIQNLLET